MNYIIDAIMIKLYSLFIIQTYIFVILSSKELH